MAVTMPGAFAFCLPCVPMVMTVYPEKRRMLDVLEPGLELELRDAEGSRLFGKVLKMLSDGGRRKAVVFCDREEGVFQIRRDAVVDVFFGKVVAGRSSLYSFESLLLEASRSGTGVECTVVISLPDNVTRRELRTNFRITISIGGKLFLENNDADPEVLPFMTQDVSAGGMRIVSASPLLTGSIGSVELDIPGIGLPRLVAEVVRSSELEGGRYASSLRFIDLSPRDEDLLFGLIRSWEQGFNAFRKKRLRIRP